ncbi:LINE-1 reverse transcriptase isogeny [Gossypium australe]|uniref:LINE-1 reverse transcriptase isogeny n=1 Tax=Gossypium australe TaxID=47621 RepID=A0A5B6UXB5_9ROSI|nr:LINE-1 reverse transcriptase isogeny [Gossypium australe]
MKKMGFERGWIDMILKCVLSVSYSVIINGLPRLSSLIRLEKTENIIKGVKASQRGPAISHLLFSDDCILFPEATERGAMSLKQILMEYETNLGQCVNFEKSVFYSSNTEEREKMTVSQVLAFRGSNDI